MARPFLIFGISMFALGMVIGGKNFPTTPADAYAQLWITITTAALVTSGIERLISMGERRSQMNYVTNARRQQWRMYK